MITLIDQGKSIDIPNIGAAAVSSTAVLVGSVVGIYAASYNVGDTATVWLHGKHQVAKNSAEVWTLGAKLYWDNTNSVFTVTATSNTFAGYAATAQANGDTSGQIILRQ